MAIPWLWKFYVFFGYGWREHIAFVFLSRTDEEKNFLEVVMFAQFNI